MFSAGTNAKTKTLGLIVPDITNPFFPRLVEAVEEIASLNGYLVLLGNTNFSSEKEDGYISAFIAKKVDGIILASVQSRYSNAYDLFKKYDVPYVLVDRNIRHSHYGAGVFVCNDYALFTACEYLIRHGNTDIAFISGPAMHFYFSGSNRGLPGGPDPVPNSLSGGSGEIRELYGRQRISSHHGAL